MRLILLTFLLWPGLLRAEGSVAYLGLVLHDTSRQTTLASRLVPTQTPRAETIRLSAVSDMVEARFLAEGFTLLDLAPIAADLDRVANPANCYGCDLRMADTLGADFVLVGEIHKVSDALLSFSLQLRDGSTGQILRGGSVDIRGNTDATWQRGMRALLNNRIFRDRN